MSIDLLREYVKFLIEDDELEEEEQIEEFSSAGGGSIVGFVGKKETDDK